jgi:hypothetical protein
MKTYSALAVFVFLAAACSNQPPPAPTAYPPSTAAPKPAVSVKATPTAATAPKETAAPATSPNTPTPGYTVLNQYDPPLPIPVSR